MLASESEIPILYFEAERDEANPHAIWIRFCRSLALLSETQIASVVSTHSDRTEAVLRRNPYLLLDLFPDDDKYLKGATSLFDWWKAAKEPAHTDASLMYLEPRFSRMMRKLMLAHSIEIWKAKIKPHMGCHLSMRDLVEEPGFIALMGALDQWDDALMETGHIENAKWPWKHSNHRGRWRWRYSDATS